MSERMRLGIVGARGHVGRELIELVARHPSLELAFASSSRHAGQPVAAVAAGAPAELAFVETEATREDAVDVLVLALPNGAAAEYLAELESEPRVIVDLSGDHRFDDAWTYGLPELNRDAIASASRISNPGCYATAMQLALSPIRDRLKGTPSCFGVSGYSGAGATPSDRNNPEKLRDNIMPYGLGGHLHEREVSRHMGHPVRFAPSVAPFFRGIMLTALAELAEPIDIDALNGVYENAFAAEPFVTVVGSSSPSLQDVVERQGAIVGGLTVHEWDARQVGIVCAIDNLLKGAASQAMQNINLALGLREAEGLHP